MTKRKRKPSSTVSPTLLQKDRERVPMGLVDTFGKLGFVKWTNAHCPVLIVDPMTLVKKKSRQRRVLEGFYHAWMYQVDLAAKKPLEELTCKNTRSSTAAAAANEGLWPVLIYWFGTKYEFSIVHLSQVMEWEVGCAQGYDQIPPVMQARLMEERPVPAVYSLLQVGLPAVRQAELVTPNQRSSLVWGDVPSSSSIVLNEWHSLAMKEPPQKVAWLERLQEMEAKLPLKEKFGTIGFLPHPRHPNYHVPVLILSPFRVPPGPTRVDWFIKCCSPDPHDDRRQTVLVYWLGAYTAGRRLPFYSFHPLSEIVPWEKGQKQGYDRLPRDLAKFSKKVQYRLDQQPLPTCQATKQVWNKALVEWLLCGNWEMEQALERDPKDRWGGMEDFEEDHDDDFEFYWECLEAGEPPEAPLEDPDEESLQFESDDDTPDEDSRPLEENNADKHGRSPMVDNERESDVVAVPSQQETINDPISEEIQEEKKEERAEPNVEPTTAPRKVESKSATALRKDINSSEPKEMSFKQTNDIDGSVASVEGNNAMAIPNDKVGSLTLSPNRSIATKYPCPEKLEVEAQVERSLLDCAAAIFDCTNDKQSPRRLDKKPPKKRFKTLDPGQSTSSPSKSLPLGHPLLVASSQMDSHMGKKQRTEETRRVVHQVVEQWLERRARGQYW